MSDFVFFLQKKRNIATIVSVVILIVVTATGYTEDLAEQIPEYTAAIGFKKYAGYVMAFLFMAYSCRLMWKDWKERK